MVRTFAGLPLTRPLIMGIINVTPDSFTDGGDYFDAAKAIEHGHRLIDEGANILDIGGESTRPGATPVDPAEEARRVLPVVAALAEVSVPLSIDTRRSAVMKAALDAGATIINDVSALTGDPQSLSVAADSSASVILMHMQGDPGTMEDNPSYNDVVVDVNEYLAARVAACLEGGIDLDRLAVDPGFGFGKTSDQNLAMLDRLQEFSVHDCPVMVGLSRKFGLGKHPKDRLSESLSFAAKALANGAAILRVHDVAETRKALVDGPFGTALKTETNC